MFEKLFIAAEIAKSAENSIGSWSLTDKEAGIIQSQALTVTELCYTLLFTSNATK